MIIASDISEEIGDDGWEISKVHVGVEESSSGYTDQPCAGTKLNDMGGRFRGE